MKRLALIFLLLMQATAMADVPAPAQPSAPPPVAENSRQHLQEILDRPQFQAWRRRLAEKDFDERDLSLPQSKWLEKKMKAFTDWLASLLRREARKSIPRQPGSSSVLPTVLEMLAWGTVIIGVVTLLVLLVLVLMRKRTGPATARILSRQQIETAMETGDALAMDAGQWMSEADRLAAEQNFRAVYRALYLALLSGLHSLGKIEHRQSRTNWTYVQRYRGPGEERQTFSELTDLFDRVWYGRFTAGAADLPVLQQKVADLTAPRRPA